jgi:hypothetical protein
MFEMRRECDGESQEAFTLRLRVRESLAIKTHGLLQRLKRQIAFPLLRHPRGQIVQIRPT